MTLYIIEKQMLEVVELLEENGGELTDEILEILNINRDELVEKIKQYRYILLKINSEKNDINNEIKRLKALLARKETVEKSLLGLVERAVDSYGLINIKSKAKEKPKKISLGTDGDVVLKYTHAIKLEPELEKKTYDEIDEELKKAVNLDYSFRLEGLNKENIAKMKKVFSVLGIDFKENLSFSKDKIKELLEVSDEETIMYFRELGVYLGLNSKVEFN